MKKLLLISILTLSACGESFDDAFDRGFSDGYASGYNTECKIRTTIIAGDWDIDGYKQGYEEGKLSGRNDCRAGK